MKLCNILAVFSILLLMSCSGMDKSQTGSAGKAGAGAGIDKVIGHNTEATLTGEAATTKLGLIVGKEMDNYDRQQLNHVYERGVSGQTSAWINPDKDAMYRVTPQPAYTTTDNKFCRKAEISAIIKGKTEKAYTTACRGDNGRWQLQ